jgi:alkylhydroperoxidase family enzyme
VCERDPDDELLPPATPSNYSSRKVKFIGGGAVRIMVPDGVDPLVHATAGLGNREMAVARAQLTRLVYTLDTTLTPRELEAARARLARINQCAFCMRYRPARDREGWADDPDTVPEAVYEHVEDPSWPGYSTRERLAITLAETYALDHTGGDDAIWNEVHANFTDDELIDLMNCLSVWFAFGRMNRMLEVDNSCQLPAAEVSALIAAATARAALASTAS